MTTGASLRRAALRAFDEAIAASPGNEALKAARERLARSAPVTATRVRERLAEVEREMARPRLDTREMQHLLRLYDALRAEIDEVNR